MLLNVNPARAASEPFALCFSGLLSWSCVTLTYHGGVVPSACKHGSRAFILVSSACAFCRQASFAALMSDASRSARRAQPSARCERAGILCERVSCLTWRPTHAVCVRSVGRCERSFTVKQPQGRWGVTRVSAGLESAGGTGPLIPVSQSRRGCWEPAVLGTTLQGGGEGKDRAAQRKGRYCKGGEKTVKHSSRKDVEYSPVIYEHMKGTDERNKRIDGRQTDEK